MSTKRILAHILTIVVGLFVTLPYFYGRKAFDSGITSIVDPDWQDWAIHGILIGMIILLFFTVRAIALLSSPLSVWRDNGTLNNIYGLIGFRDSRLKGMTNASGSVLMRETQLLDAMGSYPQGTEAHRVAEYMNSRLAGMTYEQGLQYLKSNKQ